MTSKITNAFLLSANFCAKTKETPVYQLYERIWGFSIARYTNMILIINYYYYAVNAIYAAV